MRPVWGAAVVALLAAGCGSVESQGSGESPSAEKARFEMVMTRTDMRGRMVVTGLADYRERSGVLRRAFGGGADEGESYNGNATPGDEVRIFGNTSFAEWTVKNDKTYWVEETEEPSAYPQEAIVPFPGTTLDPKRAYELILSAGDDPEELGQEEVRGEATTRYRITVDPGALPEGAHGETKSFPVDVWVDGDDRLRRIRTTETFDDEGSATLTYEFFGFGVEVDVERPTEDVISEERLDQLTRPSEDELRELCEEEIPAKDCVEPRAGG